MTAASVPPAELKRLYGVALDDFVATRTATAKALRGEGRRDEAAAVERLKKPSVAAWIVNRVARDEPDLVAALLEAGSRLREVQLAAGAPDELRDAVDAEQSALRGVMRAAEKVAAERASGSEAVRERVRETLHAAALDADLAEEVRAGVLVREQEAVGFPMGVVIAPGRVTKPAPPKRAAAKPAVSEKQLQRATEALETAREQLENAERGLAEATRAVERAGRVRDQAAARAEDALERLEKLEAGR
jgi:hypothetical protein